ncbi:MAG: tRNA 2-thiouridine(34) synthase MnmA [Ruminococcaceae bacterium]|nr:tRNA 2-thiouridine(34) synthase MnmA [Oscillospiraceae bacterium]
MKFLVGLSGGLDSTYCAHMLISEGHQVEGAVLKMGAFTDICGAEKAAERLGIKLNVIDCEKVFENIVIADFIEEYMNGRTPNPCTVCNRNIKVKYLCKYASEQGFDKAVTGHYATIGMGENGRYAVEKAKDHKKDQSYMLWMLTQEELSMLYTPLASLTKAEVRERAKEAGLTEYAELPESQEICFIPDNDYASFIKARVAAIPQGDFIDEEGKVLGKHKGLIHYTVGQKKGLGIALGKQYTVVGINAKDNTVTIVPSEDVSAVHRRDAYAGKLNFQLEEETEGEITGEAKIRYGAAPVAAKAYICNGEARVIFEKEVRAVTAGQSLVFYRDGKIVFGGVIKDTP